MNRPRRIPAALWIAILITAPFASGEAPTPSTAPAPQVWRWFGDCPHPFMMRLEVDLDGAMLYGSSIPICQVDRSRPSDHRILEFRFDTPRPVVWTGYRDTAETTQPSRTIEGNVWQAGGEPNALILGVTFADGDTLVMNTLHLARTEGLTKTEIAKGLFVRTCPIKGSAP